MKILRRFYTSILLAACLTTGSMALPEGANVTHGNVQVTTSGNTQTIVQGSNQAIINWNGFNIDVGELVHFIQPSSISAILNRVVGQDPSVILGSLRANGQVFLINPNGVVFGDTANVDVGSLVVSTLNMSDDDFLNGALRFEQSPDHELASVINHGKITVDDNGFLVLTGPMVANEGVVLANVGQVALAGGTKSTISFDPTGLIQVELPADAQTSDGIVSLKQGDVSDLLSNVVATGGAAAAGQLVERDGRTFLEVASGTVVNTGEVRAEGLGGQDGGRIVLDSSANTLLADGSVLSAAGNGVDSSGGEVYVLSDGQGLSAVGSLIDVSAGESGDGGFAEQSSDFGMVAATVDMSAENGETGTFLIDPARIIVSPIMLNPPPGTVVIQESTIENTMTGTVLLEADDQVIFDVLNGGDLTLQSGVNLTINLIGTGSGDAVSFNNPFDTITLSGTGAFTYTSVTGTDVRDLDVITDSGNIDIDFNNGGALAIGNSFTSTTGDVLISGKGSAGINTGGDAQVNSTGTGAESFQLLGTSVDNFTGTGFNFTVNNARGTNEATTGFNFAILGDINGPGRLTAPNITISASNVGSSSILDIDTETLNVTATDPTTATIFLDSRPSLYTPTTYTLVNNTGTSTILDFSEGLVLDDDGATVYVESFDADINLTTTGNRILDLFTPVAVTFTTDGAVTGMLTEASGGVTVTGSSVNLTADSPFAGIPTYDLTATTGNVTLNDITAIGGPQTVDARANNGAIDVTVAKDLSGVDLVAGTSVSVTGASVMGGFDAPILDASSTSGAITLVQSGTQDVSVSAIAAGGSGDVSVTTSGNMSTRDIQGGMVSLETVGFGPRTITTASNRIVGNTSINLTANNGVNVDTSTDLLTINTNGDVVVDNLSLMGPLLVTANSIFVSDVSVTTNDAFDPMSSFSGDLVTLVGNEVFGDITANQADLTATSGDVNVSFLVFADTNVSGSAVGNFTVSAPNNLNFGDVTAGTSVNVSNGGSVTQTVGTTVDAPDVSFLSGSVDADLGANVTNVFADAATGDVLLDAQSNISTLTAVAAMGAGNVTINNTGSTRTGASGVIEANVVSLTADDMNVNISANQVSASAAAGDVDLLLLLSPTVVEASAPTGSVGIESESDVIVGSSALGSISAGVQVGIDALVNTTGPFGPVMGNGNVTGPGFIDAPVVGIMGNQIDVNLGSNVATLGTSSITDTTVDANSASLTATSAAGAGSDLILNNPGGDLMVTVVGTPILQGSALGLFDADGTGAMSVGQIEANQIDLTASGGGSSVTSQMGTALVAPTVAVSAGSADVNTQTQNLTVGTTGNIAVQNSVTDITSANLTAGSGSVDFSTTGNASGVNISGLFADIIAGGSLDAMVTAMFASDIAASEMNLTYTGRGLNVQTSTGNATVNATLAGGSFFELRSDVAQNLDFTLASGDIFVYDVQAAGIADLTASNGALTHNVESPGQVTATTAILSANDIANLNVDAGTVDATATSGDATLNLLAPSTTVTGSASMGTFGLMGSGNVAVGAAGVSAGTEIGDTIGGDLTGTGTLDAPLVTLSANTIDTNLGPNVADLSSFSVGDTTVDANSASLTANATAGAGSNLTLNNPGGDILLTVSGTPIVQGSALGLFDVDGTGILSLGQIDAGSIDVTSTGAGSQVRSVSGSLTAGMVNATADLVIVDTNSPNLTATGLTAVDVSNTGSDVTFADLNSPGGMVVFSASGNASGVDIESRFANIDVVGDLSGTINNELYAIVSAGSATLNVTTDTLDLTTTTGDANITGTPRVTNFELLGDVAQNLDITVTSGNLEVGELTAGTSATMTASAGDIVRPSGFEGFPFIAAPTVTLTANGIDHSVDANLLDITATSGDAVIDLLNASTEVTGSAALGTVDLSGAGNVVVGAAGVSAGTEVAVTIGGDLTGAGALDAPLVTLDTNSTNTNLGPNVASLSSSSVGDTTLIGNSDLGVVASAGGTFSLATTGSIDASMGGIAAPQIILSGTDILGDLTTTMVSATATAGDVALDLLPTPLASTTVDGSATGNFNLTSTQDIVVGATGITSGGAIGISNPGGTLSGPGTLTAGGTIFLISDDIMVNADAIQVGTATAQTGNVTLNLLAASTFVNSSAPMGSVNITSPNNVAVGLFGPAGIDAANTIDIMAGGNITGAGLLDAPIVILDGNTIDVGTSSLATSVTSTSTSTTDLTLAAPSSSVNVTSGDTATLIGNDLTGSVNAPRLDLTSAGNATLDLLGGATTVAALGSLPGSDLAFNSAFDIVVDPADIRAGNSITISNPGAALSGTGEIDAPTVNLTSGSIDVNLGGTVTNLTSSSTGDTSITADTANLMLTSSTGAGSTFSLVNNGGAIDGDLTGVMSTSISLTATDIMANLSADTDTVNAIATAGDVALTLQAPDTTVTGSANDPAGDFSVSSSGNVVVGAAGISAGTSITVNNPTGSVSGGGLFNAPIVNLTSNTIDANLGANVNDLTTGSAGDTTVSAMSDLFLAASAGGTFSMNNTGSINAIAGGVTATQVSLTGSSVDALLVTNQATANATAGDVNLMGANNPLAVGGSATGAFNVTNTGVIATDQITANSVNLMAQGASNRIRNNSGTISTSDLTLTSDSSIQANTSGVSTLNASAGNGFVAIDNTGSDITSGTLNATGGAINVSNTGGLAGLLFNGDGDGSAISTGGGNIDVTANLPGGFTAQGETINLVTQGNNVQATGGAGGITIDSQGSAPLLLTALTTGDGDIGVTAAGDVLVGTANAGAGNVNIDAASNGGVTMSSRTMSPIRGGDVTITGTSMDVQVYASQFTGTANTGDLTADLVSAATVVNASAPMGTVTLNSSGALTVGSMAGTAISAGNIVTINNLSGTVSGPGTIDAPSVSVFSNSMDIILGSSVTNLTSSSAGDTTITADTANLMLTSSTGATNSTFSLINNGGAIDGDLSGVMSNNIDLTATDIVATIDASSVNATATTGDVALTLIGTSTTVTGSANDPAGDFSVGSFRDVVVGAAGISAGNSITVNNTNGSVSGSGIFNAPSVNLTSNSIDANLGGNVNSLSSFSNADTIILANSPSLTTNSSTGAGGNLSVTNTGGGIVANLAAADQVTLNASGSITSGIINGFVNGVILSGTDIDVTVQGPSVQATATTGDANIALNGGGLVSGSAAGLFSASSGSSIQTGQINANEISLSAVSRGGGQGAPASVTSQSGRLNAPTVTLNGSTIDVDTQSQNVTANSATSVDINNLGDLALSVNSTSLNLVGTGDATVTATTPTSLFEFTGNVAQDLSLTTTTGDLALTDVTAGGTATLSAGGGGNIEQNSGTVTANQVALSGGSVQANTNAPSVRAIASAGDVNLTSNSATSTTVSGSATGDFNATGSAGIAHQNISGANIGLDAGATGDITRDSGRLTSPGTISLNGQNVTAETDAGAISATAGNNATIDNFSSSVDPVSIVAGNDAAFTSVGTANISQLQSTNNLTLDVGQDVTGNFQGNRVTLAGTSVDVSVNANELTATARNGDATVSSSSTNPLTLTGSSATGDFTLSHQGDVQFDRIEAQNVTINAAGDITDTANTIVASGITLNGNNVLVNTQGQIIVINAQGDVEVSNTTVDVTDLTIDAQGNVTFGTDGNLTISHVAGGDLVELTAGASIFANSGGFVSATDVILAAGGSITPDLNNPLDVQAANSITVTAPGGTFLGQGGGSSGDIAAALSGSIPASSVIIGSGSGPIYYNGVLLNGAVPTPPPTVVTPPPEVNNSLGQQSGEVVDDGSVGSAANDGLVEQSPTQKLVAQLTENTGGGSGGSGMETNVLVTLEVDALGEVQVKLTEPSPFDAAIDDSEDMRADDVLDLETGELVDVKVNLYYDSANDQLVLAVDLRADDIIDLDVSDYELIPVNLDYSFLSDPNLTLDKLRANDLIDLEVEDLGNIPIRVHVEGDRSASE